MDQSTIESEAKSVQLLKSAQDLADTSSVWRTPTMSNYTSLLLLYFVTAFGDLGKEESQYYLFAACTHFRHLFRSTESLYSFEGRAEWAAWAVAIIDTARALDTATNPLLYVLEIEFPDSSFCLIPHLTSIRAELLKTSPFSYHRTSSPIISQTLLSSRRSSRIKLCNSSIISPMLSRSMFTPVERSPFTSLNSTFPESRRISKCYNRYGTDLID